MLFMYDAVNQSEIPSGALLVGAYVDGKYANVNAARSDHPNAFIVTITVTGQAGAIAVDCETGDLTPAAAAAWAHAERKAGRYPTIYCNSSTSVNVVTELAAFGLHFSTDPTDSAGVYLWDAGYTFVPYLYPGSVATQFSGGITAPYDISDTNGVWPYELTPNSPTPPPALPVGSLINCVGGGITPDGGGYWLVQADGGVFSKGDAPFQGSEGGVHLAAPIVGIASHPTEYGYWLVGSDGGVFAFGAANNFGSLGNTHLNKPIVAIASTSTGKGYYLVASDGGVFCFGDAKFHGSTSSVVLAQPIVDIAVDPTTGGYILIAADGGIFDYDAPFFGSLGSVKLNSPIVAGTSAVGGGYRMVGADGGLFSFKAPFYGSVGNIKLLEPVVGMANTPSGKGYYLFAKDGGVFAFGDAVFHGAGS